MSYIVQVVPPNHYVWMERHSPNRVGPDFQALAALDETKVEQCEVCGQPHPRIVGMVGYSDWTPTRCVMHFALTSPVAARALRGPAFDFVFKQQGRKFVRGFLHSSDTFRRRLATKLGFEVEATLKDEFGEGDDFLILRLPREKWEAQHV